MNARVDSMSDGKRDAWKMYVGAIERWHQHCDAILEATKTGSMREVVECVGDWLDGADAFDDPSWERYQDAHAVAVQHDGQNQLLRDLNKDD